MCDGGGITAGLHGNRSQHCICALWSRVHHLGKVLIASVSLSVFNSIRLAHWSSAPAGSFSTEIAQIRHPGRSHGPSSTGECYAEMLQLLPWQPPVYLCSTSGAKFREASLHVISCRGVRLGVPTGRVTAEGSKRVMRSGRCRIKTIQTASREYRIYLYFDDISLIEPAESETNSSQSQIESDLSGLGRYRQAPLAL